MNKLVSGATCNYINNFHLYLCIKIQKRFKRFLYNSSISNRNFSRLNKFRWRYLKIR